VDLRDAFFEPLVQVAEKDKRVIFLTNDFEVFSLKDFKKAHPNQYIDVGVSEQNMINMAAGLAWAGKKPVVFGMANFMTLRCFEQIKLQISCMNLPVTIVGVGPGFSFNFDGPSHHAISDMVLMNTLPGFHIWNLGGEETAKYLGENIVDFQNPSYVRVDKGEFPREAGEYKQGYSVVCPPYFRPTIITTGYMVERCTRIAEELMLGLIVVSRIKPFPTELKKIIRQVGHSIVVDDSGPGGPLAFQVADCFSGDNCAYSSFSFLSLDHRNTFEFGSRDYLLACHGFDLETLKSRIADQCPW